MPCFLHSFSLFLNVLVCLAQCCTDSVRLVDGGSRCAGRVEVLHRGQSWFTVCDADFDQQDAEVVCRELGCGSPVEVLGAAAFGKGEGQVWSEEMRRWSCRQLQCGVALSDPVPYQPAGLDLEWNPYGLMRWSVRERGVSVELQISAVWRG
uniref:SRCR domain-containing protein n=1 Tax=Astyanax mexicanus TaxID=7994 RepID=A0A3B1K5B7_ASTMX